MQFNHPNNEWVLHFLPLLTTQRHKCLVTSFPLLAKMDIYLERCACNQCAFSLSLCGVSMRKLKNCLRNYTQFYTKLLRTSHQKVEKKKKKFHTPNALNNFHLRFQFHRYSIMVYQWEKRQKQKYPKHDFSYKSFIRFAFHRMHHHRQQQKNNDQVKISIFFSVTRKPNVKCLI